jgi:hypothetical protein
MEADMRMKTAGLVLCLVWPVMALGDAAVDLADTALDTALVGAEACPMAVLDLTALPVDQMDVMLLAPCYAGQNVVLDHAGLELAGTLSANGALYVSLPVLRADEPVTVTFADGMMAEATLVPPMIEDVQDVAARW